MSINYKDLEIKNSNETVVLKWNDKEINVDKKISTNNKFDIVTISLQQAKCDGYFDPILLDMCFHLNLVYICTDIIFDEEDKEEYGKLYDELKDSGLLEAILEKIDGIDYQEMLDAIDEIKENKIKYDCSFASIAQKFVDDLPANAKAALDIVDNFDKDKFQAVRDFAKAANGEREIETVG